MNSHQYSHWVLKDIIAILHPSGFPAYPSPYSAYKFVCSERKSIVRLEPIAWITSATQLIAYKLACHSTLTTTITTITIITVHVCTCVHNAYSNNKHTTDSSRNYYSNTNLPTPHLRAAARWR